MSMSREPKPSPKNKRVRDKKHLLKIKSLGCCICKSPEADAHHLRIVGQGRALGLKNSDLYVVPLCRTHHNELHDFGDEALFFAVHGVDIRLLLAEQEQIT